MDYEAIERYRKLDGKWDKNSSMVFDIQQWALNRAGNTAHGKYTNTANFDKWEDVEKSHGVNEQKTPAGDYSEFPADDPDDDIYMY